jgi:hypothetical protein
LRVDLAAPGDILPLMAAGRLPGCDALVGRRERAGFTAEGLLREHRRTPDGRFRDVWLMPILRREWRAARRAQEAAAGSGPA